MRTILIAILTTSLFGPSFAQISFSRDISGFNTVKITGRFVVTLEEGDQEGVSFKIDGALEEDVIVEQKGQSVHIKMKLGIYNDADLRATLTYKKLEGVEAWSGAQLILPDLLEQDFVSLKAQAGSQISADLSVANAQALSSKGSQITLVGTSKRFEATTNTGGIIDALKLKSEKVIAKAATGSETKVQATKSLQARATSGGIIEYTGNPREKSIKETLGGEVDTH